VLSFRWSRRRLLLALAGALSIAPGALSSQQKHGDVNGDGVVSALDAQALLTAVVGLPLPAGFVIANGDADCNNTSVALDAQIVLSYVIGLNVSQYCVGQPFGSSAIRVRILPGNDAAPHDSALLVNRTLRLRAALTDTGGFNITRPVTWSTSNSDIVSIDSARGDTAWVKAKPTAGSVTLSAFSDGAQSTMVIQSVLSHAGVVITPQRSDTLRQLNSPFTFQLRTRDSLGVISGFPTGTWSTSNTAIATVTAGPSNSATLTTATNGAVWLHVTSTTSPTLKDSVRLVVRLPALNSCTGTGGTLHPATTHTTPQTWLASENPHYVSGTQTFNTGSGLTVGPGTLVCFNSGPLLTFVAGTRLVARGKQDSLITFTGATPTTTWNGILLGNDFSYTGTAPSDTSWITNALIERTGSNQGIVSRHRHALIMDSVRIRQSVQAAVQLLGPGSRLSRSTVDTMTSTSGTAVTIGQGLVELTTIRTVANMTSVFVSDTGTVRDVQIIGGSAAIQSTSSAATGMHLNNVTISGPTSFALDLQNSTVHSASANVQILSGTGGAFRGHIGNLGVLFADSLQQETLTGKGKDTLFITGGSLTNATVVVRPDLPWIVNQTTNIDTLGVLAPRPGSRMLFLNGGFRFLSGGRLMAIGEPAKFIRFSPVGTNAFFGLFFQNPGPGPDPNVAPTITSTMSYVQLDSSSGSFGTPDGGLCCAAAINAGNRHRLIADSIIVRKSHEGAVFMAAAGSELRRSLIDTTGHVTNSYIANYPAVALGKKTLAQNVLVRRSGDVGLYANAGTNDTIARLVNVRIVASREVGLQVDNGILEGDHGLVRVDSANAYPFQGRIQHLAAIARDSVSQLNLKGNIDDVVVIVGGSLQGVAGTHTPASPLTLEVIPGLRWQVTQSPNVDTLARLLVRPASNITFSDGILHFTRGGSLNAVGEPAKFIHFRPVGANNWSGLRFDEPGAGPGPAPTWPYAVSTMTYVRVDSASGTSLNAFTTCCFTSAIAGATRHRLLMDSIIVHKAHNNALWINARGSVLQRSVIDTTGNVGSGYTTGEPALVLGDTITVQNTLVRRSGFTGLYAPRHRALLTNVRVVASQNVGLRLDVNAIDPASTNVKADSANAYPFYGRIDNFGVIANTGALQISNLIGSGNVDNVAVIVAGTLTNRTVEVIPQLRWQVTQSPVVDTLAVLLPQPGADITFTDGSLRFAHGGTLNAMGTSTSFIRFRPVAGFNWQGLQFDEPGAGSGGPGTWPYAVSTMTFVRVDSAAGVSLNAFKTCCFTSAISGATRHRLQLDSIIVHKAHHNALWLNASGSYVRRSLIDTTGTVGTNYQTGEPAVVLSDSMEISRTTVRRSGHDGVDLRGFSLTLDSVRVVNSRLDGFALNRANTTFSGNNGVDALVADSSGGNGFSIRASNITLTRCVATRGLTASSHGVAMNGNHAGTAVNNCDFVNNGGNGVNNTFANSIDASNNFWGDADGPLGPQGDGVAGNVTTVPICSASCTDPSFLPFTQQPGTPAIPPRQYNSRALLRSTRRRNLRLRERASKS
jgi:hypothetical protein